MLYLQSGMQSGRIMVGTGGEIGGPVCACHTVHPLRMHGARLLVVNSGTISRAARLAAAIAAYWGPLEISTLMRVLQPGGCKQR